MSQVHSKHHDNNYEIKKFFGMLLKNWYWIALSLLVSLSTSYLLIRYANEVYMISTSFNTKKFDQTDNNPFDFIAKSNPLLQQASNISQEIPLLKSQSRIQATLDRLDFSVSYFVEGRFKTTEVYPYDYYQVTCDNSNTAPTGFPIRISHVNNSTFTLSTENPRWNNLFSNQTFEYDKDYSIDNWKFNIVLRHDKTPNSQNSSFFIVNSKGALLNEYRGRLMLKWQNVNSKIIDASITSKTPVKDVDFLETYVQVIIDKGLEDKNEQYTNTIKFIDSYIPTIADTIRTFKKRLNSFELKNGDLIGNNMDVLSQINRLEQEKSDLFLANKYYDYLADYVRNEREDGVFAPVMVGLNAQPISQLMEHYTQVQWLDKLDKNPENQENPLINKSAEEIQRMKLNIFESVKNLKRANTEQIDLLDQKIVSRYQTLRGFQAEEQDYAEIKTQADLYQDVYNNLIEHKTESILAQASTVSDYEMLSKPKFDARTPISPDAEKYYLIAIFLGLGLPIGIIYLRQAMNDSIVTMHDLKQRTNIPLLGNVGHSPDGDNLAVFNSPKSLVAESFRAVRSSLQYISKNSNSKNLLITSSVSGEGKTFSSINLGLTFASLNHKVLLIGADMRKPTLSRNFNLDDSAGLSDYLAGLCTLEEAIHTFEQTSLHVIPGGHIPPNPSELLLSDRMNALMEWAQEHYDHIIIDTPPINLVTDAFDLMKYADIKLLIVRQGVTSRNSFLAVDDMRKKEQQDNWYILFNDIDFSKLAYGYNYGYKYGLGYYHDEKPKKSFLGRIFNK